MKIEEILEHYSLKELPRAGWERVKIGGPEAVASHSWGVAWLGLLLCPPSLNKQRVLELSLVHDLIEVRTGDITPYDGISPSTKKALESEAAEPLLSSHPGLLATWKEYEAHLTKEAKFVHELDKLDMAIQALVYAKTRGINTLEFIESAESSIRHPSLRQIFDQVIQEIQKTI